MSLELEKNLKVGEWNKMKVVVKGNNVTTWLNGQQMTTLDDEKIGSVTGKIAMQIHDGGGVKVRWRKIMVKELLDTEFRYLLVLKKVMLKK